MAFERLNARRARNQQIYGPDAWKEWSRARRTAMRPSRVCGLAGALILLLSSVLSGTARVAATCAGVALLVASMVLFVPYVRAMASETRKLREKRRAWESEHPDA